METKPAVQHSEEQAMETLPEKRERKPPRKGRSKKKWVALGALALATVSVVVFLTTRPGKAALTIARSDIGTVATADGQRTVSATATVESADSTSVYSTLTDQVQEVSV